MMEYNQEFDIAMRKWTDVEGFDEEAKRNPCGEEKLDSAGGFLVPGSIAKGVKDFFLEGTRSISRKVSIPIEESGMRFFETGRWRLNLDQVSDFRYDLDEITKELSAGDIYTVTISINMVNGDQYLLEDLAEMYTFVLMTNKESRDCVPETKTLGYYLQRSKDYLMVKEAKEKEKA